MVLQWTQSINTLKFILKNIFFSLEAKLNTWHNLRIIHSFSKAWIVVLLFWVERNLLNKIARSDIEERGAMVVCITY